MGDFNYGKAELSKVDEGSDRFAVKFWGRREDGTDAGETRTLTLNPEQYAQVAKLIVSFNL